MSNSDLVAAVLLFIAVTDTWFAQSMLPKMLAKNPVLSPEDAKKLQKIINVTTLLCFTIAVVVYITKPLG